MRYTLRVSGRATVTVDKLDDLLFILWDYVTLHDSSAMFVTVISTEIGKEVTVNVLRFLLCVASGHEVERLLFPHFRGV